MPTEELCALCREVPVMPGKPMCTSCWQLAPIWVRKSIRQGEKVDWARLLEPDSITPPQGGEPTNPAYEEAPHAD